jgi:Na+(H+)/acetate symporter ActP
MILNFALALIVSRLTAPPPEELQEIVRAVRRPETLDEANVEIPPEHAH